MLSREGSPSSGILLAIEVPNRPARKRTASIRPDLKSISWSTIALDKEFKAKGYPVIAINPNDVDLKSEDSLKGMKKRSDEKGFTFPYLKDANYEVFKTYGATRTPHTYLLQKSQREYFTEKLNYNYCTE